MTQDSLVLHWALCHRGCCEPMSSTVHLWLSLHGSMVWKKLVHQLEPPFPYLPDKVDHLSPTLVKCGDLNADTPLPCSLKQTTGASQV